MFFERCLDAQCICDIPNRLPGTLHRVGRVLGDLDREADGFADNIFARDHKVDAVVEMNSAWDRDGSTDGHRTSGIGLALLQQ
jgi:hypothetical protein